MPDETPAWWWLPSRRRAWHQAQGAEAAERRHHPDPAWLGAMPSEAPAAVSGGEP